MEIIKRKGLHKGAKAFLYDTKSKFFHTVRDGMVLGRRPGPECVQLADDDGISRDHARIYYIDGRFCLEDLFSGNGTKINGNGLSPGRKATLFEGDLVQIGSLSLIFTLSDARKPKMLAGSLPDQNSWVMQGVIVLMVALVAVAFLILRR